MDSNLEKEKKQIEEARASLEKVLEQYAKAKKEQTELLSFVAEKKFEYEGMPCKAALTKGGAIMILFGSEAGRKIYFDKIGK